MEQNQITIVVAVIRNENGEVLLAQRHQPQTPEVHGKWEFVGGGIDFGEDPIEALKREVKEEIGVVVEVIKLLPKVISDIQNFDNGNKVQVIVISYECKIISGQAKSTDPEVGELRFVSIDDIKNYDTFKNIQETIGLLTTIH